MEGARIIKDTNIKHGDSIEIGRDVNNIDKQGVGKDKD